MTKNTKASNAPRERRRERPLKLAPLIILRILEQKTSEDSPMSEADIAKEVEACGLTLERKAVTNNLWMLLEFEPRVHRKAKQRGAQTVSCGWYCDPYFDVWEVRYLADAVAGSRRIRQSARNALMKKIGALGGGIRTEGFADIYRADPKPLGNDQFFLTVWVLDEALQGRFRVRFRLGDFDLRGQLHTDKNSIMHQVDPQFMAVSDGRYYLAASYPGNAKLYHYRIDLMLDAEICCDAEGEPIPISARLDGGLDITQYLEKHLYLYSDPIEQVRFRIPDTPSARHQVFDRFGASVELRRASGSLEGTVFANAKALRYWALQYSDIVEVLEPQSLRDDLRDAAERAVKKYARRG